MQQEDNFINLVKEKFKVDVREIYLPNQIYINWLISSLDRVEVNSYSKSQAGFISEYKYLKGLGALQSIKEFVDGCLNQLLWIDTILESGKLAKTEDEFEEKFSYETPIMLGDYWTLNKVTNKGVFFRGAEPYQDSRVIINSENIIEITIALSKVVQKYTAKKNEQAKSIVILDPKVNDSSLFISKELETKCLNILKEIDHPILNVDGNFMNKHGMKGGIVVWYDKCLSLHFISNNSRNRDEIANEVMKLIPDLSIDGSNFDKSPDAKKYKKDIEQKLAELSHK